MVWIIVFSQWCHSFVRPLLTRRLGHRYCPQCKNHKQATKKFDLWRLPEVLVVHLKRFSDSRWHRRKLDTLVEFPIEYVSFLSLLLVQCPGSPQPFAPDVHLRSFDVTSYVQRNGEGQQVYDLHAVSCHFGGLGGGHCMLFSRHGTFAYLHCDLSSAFVLFADVDES